MVRTEADRRYSAGYYKESTVEQVIDQLNEQEEAKDIKWKPLKFKEKEVELTHEQKIGFEYLAAIKELPKDGSCISINRVCRKNGFCHELFREFLYNWCRENNCQVDIVKGNGTYITERV